MKGKDLYFLILVSSASVINRNDENKRKKKSVFRIMENSDDDGKRRKQQATPTSSSSRRDNDDSEKKWFISHLHLIEITIFPISKWAEMKGKTNGPDRWWPSFFPLWLTHARLYFYFCFSLFRGLPYAPSTVIIFNLPCTAHSIPAAQNKKKGATKNYSGVVQPVD